MKIERDINQKLSEWKNSDLRQPLILQGARQIGKTWAVTEFGQNNFKHIAVFNFDRQQKLHEVFRQSKDVRYLLRELAFYTDVPLVAGETLIFFDEIQECSDALNSLKYFDEDAPEFHIIAAGSLLGVALNHKGQGFPVGKVQFMQMHPITFREYLRAADSKLYNNVDKLTKGLKEPLPTAVFDQLSEYYKTFQLCGGMPRATSAMIDGKGVLAVENILQDTLLAYSGDFGKHIENKDIPRLNDIWKSIPSQLSRENNKFIFKAVRTGARAREYESALDWLALSGMIYKVSLTETPALPMTFYEDISAFKVYLLDIALLRTLAHLPKEVIVSAPEMYREFKGAMAENYVLCSLVAQGFETPHYWTLQGNKAEVDFLVTDKLSIIPIEVKSDTRISGKSFAVYNEKYKPELRIRLSMLNSKQDGNLLNLPIFLCDWLREILG